MISVFFKIFFIQKIYILDYIQLIILVFVYRLVAQPGQRARLITVRSWVRIPASLLLILLIFSIFYTQCQFYRLFWIFFRYFLEFLEFFRIFFLFFYLIFLFYINAKFQKYGFSMYIFMYCYTFIYLKVQYIIREKSW